MKQKRIRLLFALCVLFACVGLSACEGNEPVSLSAPERLQITNDVLRWDKVEHADDYAVYIEDVEHITKDNFYDLSELNQNRTYEVEVVAYANGGKNHSEGSKIAYIGKNAPPTEGLNFQVDSNYCSVKKLTADENGICIIPETYNNQPITSFITKMSYQNPERIKVLYLPSTLIDNKLRNGALYSRLTNLEYVYIREGNERFTSMGGGIVDLQENALTLGGTKTVIPDSVTKIVGAYAGRAIKSFTIPEQVMEIGTQAFFNCTQLEEVVLPKRVMEGLETDFRISLKAFSGCTKLKKMILPERVAERSEWESVFYFCGALERVAVPAGVVYLNGTFDRCTSLKEAEIPDGVINMNNCFYGCSALVKTTVPKGVETLDMAFYKCSSLESIRVPGSVKSLAGTFAGCSSLKSVILEEGVETISYISLMLAGGSEYYAFQNCVSLTEITLPSTLKKIEKKSFQNCRSLTSITIPENVTSIEYDAFNGCDNLIQTENGVQYVDKWVVGCDKNVTSVTLREGTRGIADQAFFGCRALTSVTIPNGATSIGDSAFSYCNSLTSVTIPDSVTSIGDRAFNGCNSLTSVTIPNGVTGIGESAFYGCNSLTNITIPNSVTSIGDYAFKDCSALTNITIPNGVTSIGDYAFKDCSALTSVTIPDSVTSIGDNAFAWCSSLTIYCEAKDKPSDWSSNWNDLCPVVWDCIKNKIADDGSIYIKFEGVCYALKDGKATVARQPSNLESANISAVVTYQNADYNVTTIIERAFNDCSKLTNISLSVGVTSIGDEAFRDCGSLTSITIPNGVTSIGEGAFVFCSSLTSVTIPDSVTSIGDYAFNKCGSLTDITFKGTKAQWNSIEKGSKWDNYTGDYIVHCTDGDIQKS